MWEPMAQVMLLGSLPFFTMLQEQPQSFQLKNASFGNLIASHSIILWKTRLKWSEISMKISWGPYQYYKVLTIMSDQRLQMSLRNKLSNLMIRLSQRVTIRIVTGSSSLSQEKQSLLNRLMGHPQLKSLNTKKETTLENWHFSKTSQELQMLSLPLYANVRWLKERASWDFWDH